MNALLRLHKLSEFIEPAFLSCNRESHLGDGPGSFRCILSGHHADGLSVAGGGTKATADTALDIYTRHVFYNLDCSHRTPFLLTHTASSAQFRINLGIPSAPCKGIGVFELRETSQHGAAARAAVAEKVEAILAVIGSVDEAGLLGAGNYGLCFLSRNLLGKLALNKELCKPVKSEAYIAGFIARSDAYPAGAL